MTAALAREGAREQAWLPHWSAVRIASLRERWRPRPEQPEQGKPLMGR